MKTTKIRLLSAELIYDIRNTAYVESHLIDDGTAGSQHRCHLVADVCEEGNLDIVSRSLLLAFAALQWALARAGVAPAPCYTDRLTLPETFELSLSTSIPLTHARAALLTELAHHYMTAMALSHWLSITHGAAAGKWGARAAECERRLTALAASYSRATTRRLSPF